MSDFTFTFKGFSAGSVVKHLLVNIVDAGDVTPIPIGVDLKLDQNLSMAYPCHEI